MKERELNLLLIKVSATHRRISTYEFMKHGLSAGQPRMLNYISQNDGCIQREIARACHLEPASVTSVLNSMEKAGLVVRKPMEDDKRAFQVYLTDKGREMKGIVDEIFTAIEKECFKGFSEEEKLLARDLLMRIHRNMLDAEQGARTVNEKVI